MTEMNIFGLDFGTAGFQTREHEHSCPHPVLDVSECMIDVDVELDAISRREIISKEFIA